MIKEKINKLRKCIFNKIISRVNDDKDCIFKEEGMEMIQVAILIAIAIILGLIFKTEITSFVNKTFESLNSGF